MKKGDWPCLSQYSPRPSWQRVRKEVDRITAASSQASAARARSSSPLVTPVTGGAGFLGPEQWLGEVRRQDARKPLGLKVQFVLGDTPVEQGPAPAQALAQKYVADKSVVVILGPSTSGAVAASSADVLPAGIAHISPSATRTSLTQGSPKEATPAFFRVVPGDYIQGPTDANYMINSLKVKKVVLLDFQEPYSPGLADASRRVLKKAGVTTVRLSAPNTTTDYSAYVTKVPSDADIVFFPTQKPGDAQTFAQQLIEQGKKAKVFGGDGSNDPSRSTAGLVRVELRPGHHRHQGGRSDHRGLEEGQPRQDRRLLRPAELRRRRRSR